MLLNASCGFLIAGLLLEHLAQIAQASGHGVLGYGQLNAHVPHSLVLSTYISHHLPQSPAISRRLPPSPTISHHLPPSPTISPTRACSRPRPGRRGTTPYHLTSSPSDTHNLHTISHNLASSRTSSHDLPPTSQVHGRPQPGERERHRRRLRPARRARRRPAPQPAAKRRRRPASRRPRLGQPVAPRLGLQRM